RSTVQALAKGLRILEAFSADRREMTLSEIAAATGLDPGTTFRMLNTLVKLGYVARVPGTRRFMLSLKVLDLGFHAIARTDLREIIRPILRSLVGEISEAASFGVLDGADILYIERVRAGLARLGVDIRIGTTIPASVSAIGHSVLAFLPEGEVDRVLAAAPRRPTLPEARVARNEILAALDEVRRQGYALRDSFLGNGLRVLAMPVLDADGYPVGAISITAPAVRCPAEEFHALALGPVRAAAQSIARALEASGSTSVTP
ncbi:MAG: IclR family transcriptional regulator, partial [Pseudomonadota bacterium]|nr:IclR family transcriptional regulator [Pseudomonadota bacterium]